MDRPAPGVAPQPPASCAKLFRDDLCKVQRGHSSLMSTPSGPDIDARLVLRKEVGVVSALAMDGPWSSELGSLPTNPDVTASAE